MSIRSLAWEIVAQCSSMGNCGTKESSSSELDNDVARVKNTFNDKPPPSTLTTNIILHDEGTGTDYRVGVVNDKTTVWSTVIQECSKQHGIVKKINYGGTDISDTMTWEQLGISDDATVMVYTDKVR